MYCCPNFSATVGNLCRASSAFSVYFSGSTKFGSPIPPLPDLNATFFKVWVRTNLEKGFGDWCLKRNVHSGDLCKQVRLFTIPDPMLNPKEGEKDDAWDKSAANTITFTPYILQQNSGKLKELKRGCDTYKCIESSLVAATRILFRP